MTYDEQRAILNYKSSESYVLNEALRSGIELNKTEAKLLSDLKKAMGKFLKYSGIVYRNIGFATNEQLFKFMVDYFVGKPIVIKGFISTSKSKTGYELDNSVPYKLHYEIEAKDGFDVANIGLKEEQEILLKHNTEFIVSDITYNGSEVFIKMKEVEKDAQSETRNSSTITGTENTMAKRGQENELVGENERYIEQMDSVQGRVSEDNAVPDTKSDSNGGRDIVSDVRDSISVREGDRDKSRTQGVSEQRWERIRNQALTDTNSKNEEDAKNDEPQSGVLARESKPDDRGLRTGASRSDAESGAKTIDEPHRNRSGEALSPSVIDNADGYTNGNDSKRAYGTDDADNAVSKVGGTSTTAGGRGGVLGERKETVYLRSADSGGSDNDTGREGKAVRTGKEIFRETSQEEIKRTDFVRHKGDKNTEIVFSQILPDDYTEKMISLAKKNSEINLETVFTDGKIELYDKNGNLIRIIEDGCYNKANRTIYINCQSKEKLKNINEHEKVHAFKRINPTAYEDLLADVGDCVYTEKFMSEIDGYVKPYESAYNKKADFEEIIEEILAILSYEIYSDNIPDYVADVNDVQKAYETFWKSAKIERRNLDNVHDGVLAGESENDSTVRKPEPISQVEEERDTGAENRELGENVTAENRADVQDTQREKTATKSEAKRKDCYPMDDIRIIWTCTEMIKMLFGKNLLLIFSQE